MKIVSHYDGARLFILFISDKILADGDGCEPVEDATAYTKENNAYSADGKCQLGVEIALERGQG